MRFVQSGGYSGHRAIASACDYKRAAIPDGVGDGPGGAARAFVFPGFIAARAQSVHGGTNQGGLVCAAGPRVRNKSEATQ